MKRWLFGFFGVFLSGLAYAANFPPGTQIEIINDFSGGLNTTSPNHKIPKNFSPNMLNVNISKKPGQIIKRNGFILAGSTTSLQNGRLMFTFNHQDGSKEFIVSDDSQVFTTKDYKLYTFISSGLNNSVHLCAIQVRDKVWFTNGINAVFTWDGTIKQILDGSLGTPNVPRFRYLVYYQERVFGLNIAANNSLLQWSDVVSTNGAIITPDSFLAWPSINALNVGQGDGQVGTSLWLYRGQLQIGKDRSIYTLYGTNSTNYVPRKTEAQAGVSSNESVIILDGFTYYIGYDGIYAYDGQTSKRISDAIIPNVQAINNSPNFFVNNIWETQADFLRGHFSSATSVANTYSVFNTTVTADGLVILCTTGTKASTFRTPSPALGELTHLTPGSPSAGFVVMATTEAFDPNGIFTSSGMKVQLSINASIGGSAVVEWFLKNLRTGDVLKFVLGSGGSTFLTAFFNTPTDISRYIVTGATSVWTGNDIMNGNLAISVNWTDPSDADSIDVSQSNINASSLFFVPLTTGQYISDIATITATITSWGNFDSVNNTNGGNINYYFHSSTSLVNIATQTWQSITPGVAIAAPTINNFIQWAATISASPFYPRFDYPSIDNVVISHVEGSGSRDRPFAIDWKNEYWLSIATETTGMFSIQYVKGLITGSNPIAWQPYQGMNIRSFCKDGTNTLYGGSASSGTFYRLDYGTNDNGQTIDGFYETPRLILKGALFGGLEGNWMEEQITELWMDADAEDANTLNYGLSIADGSYVENPIDLSGNSRILKVLYNQSKFAKYFSLRARNNQLDKGLGVNGMAILYVPLPTR